MKNKELEKRFLENINSISSYKSEAFYLNHGGEPWILLGQELFHINIKKNTLFLKPFELMIANSNAETLAITEWVAIKNQDDKGEMKIILGNDDPYQNEAMKENIQGKEVVRAIPYSYIKKMTLK